MKNRIAIIVFYLIVIIQTTLAQKVGIVLSGGGAKGLVHIGVIKALEENNIPIDYITGTSMGAIIGGLYALGYSPDEMIRLFKSDDFKMWSTGVIPPKYKYYFKQLDENPSFIDLDFKRKDEKIKLTLPTNLIPSNQMDFAFMELFSPGSAECKNDFNQLFVPFRCVATDIYKNDTVVFRRGNLGQAIRASMSVPFYFKPIEIDSVLLFDGGILNNFPVDVMKQDFKPDFVIGSAVNFKNRKPDKDNLGLQLQNLIMRKTKYEIPDSLGVLIKSPTDHIALLDFERIDESIKVGYETTIAQIQQIKSRISRRSDLEQLNKRREEFRSKLPSLKFNNIQVSGVDGSQRYYIIRSIRHKSSTFDLESLRTEYFKILADDKIKSLIPTADFDRNSGYFDLQLDADQKNPLAVGVGGYFSLSDVNQGYIGMDYRLFNNLPITIQSNIHIGKFYSSILLGGRINFITRQPFSLEAYFVKNRWDFYSGTTQLLFEDKTPHYVIRNDDNVILDLCFPGTTISKWEAGINYFNYSDRFFQTTQYTKNDVPDETEFTAGNVHMRYEIKAFDKKQYPTQGKMLTFETSYTFGTEKEALGSLSGYIPEYRKKHNYLQFDLSYERYFKTAKWLTIGIMTETFLSNKNFFNNYTSTLIASKSFVPTVNTSMRYLQNLRSNNFVAGGMRFIIPLSPSTHVRLEGYYFQPFKEVLSDTNNLPFYSNKLFTTNQITGCGGIVIHTPFGPASLLLNYFSRSDPKFYLQASFGYLLFNRHQN